MDNFDKKMDNFDKKMDNFENYNITWIVRKKKQRIWRGICVCACMCVYVQVLLY